MIPTKSSAISLSNSFIFDVLDIKESTQKYWKKIKFINSIILRKPYYAYPYPTCHRVQDMHYHAWLQKPNIQVFIGDHTTIVSMIGKPLCCLELKWQKVPHKSGVMTHILQIYIRKSTMIDRDFPKTIKIVRFPRG